MSSYICETIACGAGERTKPSVLASGCRLVGQPCGFVNRTRLLPPGLQHERFNAVPVRSTEPWLDWAAFSKLIARSGFWAMPRLSTPVRKLIKWIPDKPIVSAFLLLFLFAGEGNCFADLMFWGSVATRALLQAFGVAALIQISRAGRKAGSLCS